MIQKEWKERENIYACWLCNFPGITNAQMHELLSVCGGAEAAYYAGQDVWGKVLSAKQAESLKKYTADWHPHAEYCKMAEQGIRLITFGDEEYPQRLKNIPDAPYGIFVRGGLPLEDVPAVAVIGARECSEYGRFVAKQLGLALGRRGVAVISGMARGIDGISQEAALEAGGVSVGVLGSGVDICYPAQNKKLYERLLKTGAVISTCPIGTPALSWNFPPRNRIVSGLADVVVVIEARIKSGTLITVDMALEQGREVYVVPGRVTDRLSDGCNRLLKQGAGAFLDPESFLEELWELRERKKGYAADGKNRMTGYRGDSAKKMQDSSDSALPENLSKELAEVYKALDFHPKTPEEIRHSLPTQYPDKQIITCLMQLSMEKLAIQVSPGQFCRRGV